MVSGEQRPVKPCATLTPCHAQRIRLSTANTSTPRTCWSRPSARARACSTNPAACATTPKSWPSWVPAVHQPHAGHAQMRKRSAVSMPEHQGHHPQAAGRHGRHGHLPRLADGLNLGGIIETLNKDGARDHHGAAFHARDRARRQARARSSAASRCRYCLARIPKAAKCAATWPPAAGRSAPLSAPTAKSPGPWARCWQSRGLLLVGLDVIGDCVTEINVTSPTLHDDPAERPAHCRYCPRAGNRRQPGLEVFQVAAVGKHPVAAPQLAHERAGSSAGSRRLGGFADGQRTFSLLIG